MSKLLSRAGIQGNFCPFTLESNINVDMPVFIMPAAMKHELAHQCGFMHEGIILNILILGNIEINLHQYCCTIQVFKNKNTKVKKIATNIRISNINFNS